jgi:hypothetical protein
MELSSGLREIVKLVQDKEVKRSLRIGKVPVTLDTSESAFGTEETGGATSRPHVKPPDRWLTPSGTGTRLPAAAGRASDI